MMMEMVFSVLLGVGLAASSGFRVFVPLFALSCASYFHIIELNAAWAWAGSITALIILGVASIVEGGGAAASIKGSVAATRVVSTATTGGLANPAVSVAETGTAIGLSALSIFAPILAMVALFVGLIFFIFLMTKLKNRKH